MEYPGITRIIADHYSLSDKPLLLSQLGQHLKNSDQWPIPGEERTLAQVLADLTPPLEIVKEGASGSYVVVVPPEYKHIAEAAIQNRSNVKYLRSVPRVVLIAFCVDEKQRDVYIRSVEPYDYVIESDYHDPNYILINIEYRCPGLYVGNVADMAPVGISDLARNIQQWCSENGIEFSKPKIPKERPKVASTGGEGATISKAHSGTALDRLYDAQRPEIAQGMNIPLDIAQLLSRLP